jgi:hypothetical protein
MKRQRILDLMGELKPVGMKAAFDEVLANGLKQQHPVQQIIGDLLAAEIAEKQARSIRYQIAAAKLPLAKGDGGLRLQWYADQREPGARPGHGRLPGTAAQRRAGGWHRHRQDTRC